MSDMERDPFEDDVRAAFRRHLGELDPLVPRPLERGDVTAGGTVRVAVVAGRTSHALPGLAFVLVLVAVVAVALIGPDQFRRGAAATPSASPSPIPAQWTGLDWAHGKSDGGAVEGDMLNAAWHDGWVLASDRGVSFSADGSSWTRTQTFPSANFVLAAATARGFVVTETYAVSTEPDLQQVAVWHSEDGRTWALGDAGRAFDGQNQVWDLAAGPQGVVAVGLSWPAGRTTGADPGFGAWFSPDGASWQRIAPDQALFGTDLPWTVAAIPGGFLIGGSLDGTSMIWFSPDGLRWERTAFPGTAAWLVRSVAAGAAGIVATESPTTWSSNDSLAVVPSRAWASKDGRHWTPLSAVNPPAYVFGDGVRIVGRWNVPRTAPDQVTAFVRYAVSFDGLAWSAIDEEADTASWAGWSGDTVLIHRFEQLYAVPVIVAAPPPSPAPALTPNPTR